MSFRHKPFKKKPSPRKPRPPSGPARAGFTYGYQWSEYQPHPELKFPMEFGVQVGGQPIVRFYPVPAGKTNKAYGVHKGEILLMPEFPNAHFTVQAPTQWHPPLPPHRLVPEYVEGTFDSVDFARLSVALDWHAEYGFDLNPFHLSGKSWGVMREMTRLFGKQFGRTNGVRDPVRWMDELVEYFEQVQRDGEPREWQAAPETVWWLDTELHNLEEWHDLRRRLFGPSEEEQQAQDEEDAVAHSADLEPDVEAGDITTEDHRHWYQYGRLYFTGDEEGLERQMVRDNFFPNVWGISDHGNSHLIDVHGEALRLMQERASGHSRRR